MVDKGIVGGVLGVDLVYVVKCDFVCMFVEVF